MEYKLEIEIPDLPKSLNKALRTHRIQRNNENKRWYNLIHYSTLKNKPEKPLQKAKIRLTRYFYRTLDFDDLVASFKPVVDGLIHAGIIEDDAWRVTGPWEVDQIQVSKSAGKRVKIIVESI